MCFLPTPAAQKLLRSCRKIYGRSLLLVVSRRPSTRFEDHGMTVGARKLEHDCPPASTRKNKKTSKLSYIHVPAFRSLLSCYRCSHQTLRSRSRALKRDSQPNGSNTTQPYQEGTASTSRLKPAYISGDLLKPTTSRSPSPQDKFSSIGSQSCQE